MIIQEQLLYSFVSLKQNSKLYRGHHAELNFHLRSVLQFLELPIFRSGTRNPLVVTLVLQPTSCNRPSLLKPAKYTSLYSNRYSDSLPFSNYHVTDIVLMPNTCHFPNPCRHSVWIKTKHLKLHLITVIDVFHLVWILCLQHVFNELGQEEQKGECRGC